MVDAIWFNQGQVCCAGSRLLVAESVAEAALRQAARAHGEAAGRRSARQVDRHRRHRRAGPARAHPPARARGRGGGARVLPRRRTLPARGCFYPPTLVTGVEPASVLAREEIFGPVLVADDLPHPGRSGRARQQHPLRPCRLRLDREHQPRARGRGAHQGGRRLDQLDQPVRRRRRLRRLSRERLRPRGRARGPRTNIASPTRQRPSRSRRGRRASTLRPAAIRRRRHGRRRLDRTAKLLHRRQAGAARWRLQLCGSRSRGPRGRPRGAWQSQGHPQRRRGGGQGAVLGRGDGAQPRAGALLRRREPFRARGRIRPAPRAP